VLQQPLFHLGDFAAARRHQERAFGLYDKDLHRDLTAVYGEDPGVGCLVYGAATLWHLGYPDQAVRLVEASRELAEQLGNPFNVARALYLGTFTHLCRRDAGRVQELAAALLELCCEQGFAMLVAGAGILHGWSLTEQGRLDEGIGQMREGLAGWQATGALSHRPYHLALLAEALGRQGRAEEGLTLLAEAEALSGTTGERFYEAELHRLRGELLLRAAGPGEAEPCFRRALAVAGGQGARPLQLRAAMSLSRLHAQQGRPEESRALLAEAHQWFSEGFDTADWREAKALLAQLQI
jgi:predicted ATPase